MSFDTRNAVAGARAFQRELKTTGRVAEETSKAGRNLEQNFSALGSQKTRAALRGLQSALMGAKDGTDAAIAGAKALQVALVKSIAGTAIISGVGLLADSIRDVATNIKTVAQDAARASKNMGEFANSFQEGAARAASLNTAADNVAKTLDTISAGSFFTRFLNDATGATKELKAQEETLRRMAQSEFQMGAATGRATAERRVGMTPEQVAADIRAEEEKKRLQEAETMGGPSARADVQATIDAENEQKRREEGAKSQKAFEKDVASTQEKIAKIQEAQAKSVEQKRLDALVPAARIVELDKEAAKVAEKIAEITKTGIYGTEEARKKQLEEIVALEQRSVDLANEKTKALQEQKDEEQAIKKRAEDEATAKRNVEIEERKRARESGRSRKENQAFLRQAQEQLRQKSLEEQLARFFGKGAWASIPENIRNQMLQQGVSNQHLSMISRNTEKKKPSEYSWHGTRYGRPKSGPGMERPEGYVPEPGGVDVMFPSGAAKRRGRPSVVSPNNPYRPTRIRGEGGFSIGPEDHNLASAIKALADKIPASVPV